MVGNSHEMLLYLLYDEGVRDELKLTPERTRTLRSRISQHNISEEYITETLIRLGCRCIRPQVILPCIVKDKNGRLYDEYTFTQIFFTREIADKYHANYELEMAQSRQNKSISRPLFKHVLRSRRAWIVQDNFILDSVWSYEPIEITFHREKVIQVRNMLANSLPVSEHPWDILTYRRNYPRTWRPDEDGQ